MRGMLWALTACLCASLLTSGAAPVAAEPLDVGSVPPSPGPSIVVDGDHIASVPCGQGCDPARFLYGTLPLAALDGLCGTDDTTPDEVLLGDLYVSGFSGGVWLARDVLGRPVRPGPFRQAPGPLADMAAHGLDVARAGGQGAEAYAAQGLGPLLFMHGYNRGYLEVVLAKAPPDLDPPVSVSFSGLLRTDTDAFDLTSRNRFDATRAAIDHPGGSWLGTRLLVEMVVRASIPMGRAVWNILAADGLPSDSYRNLVDLSAGFLLATEATVLATVASAHGDRDATACAVRLQTGLGVWTASYFAGLLAAV